MNDPLIRRAFHSSFLKKDHASANTLIVDELGIDHGKCRADIAVINGHYCGFEIKSEKDTLVRLNKQIEFYDAIFDQSTIVVEQRHLVKGMDLVPKWWGVILVKVENEQTIGFETIREPCQNLLIDDIAVAQLLWRNEAQDILGGLGVKGKHLRECRANLYQSIIELLEPQMIRGVVKEYLMKRQTWRRPLQQPLYDGLPLPISM
ncbi:MAG: sce7726 family protein [Anaerolineaceae bacterium]